MLLGGLWHGANWTFVIWGALHGAYLAAHKFLLGGRRPQIETRHRDWPSWPIELVKMAGTFHLVALAWVFFRVDSVGQGWTYLAGIFALNGAPSADLLASLIVSATLLLLIDVAQYTSRSCTPMFGWAWPVRAAAYATMVLAMLGLRTDEIIPFIYFQF
jgi:D-alanyl-lipoteichoic acid acyltransferase DltB (MBOAT superfamily)